MRIQEIPNFNWPKPEQLRNTGRGRNLTSKELLILKSRSFALPIAMLGLTRGNSEANKEIVVTDTYNVLRELDTIEDSDPQKISYDDKKRMIDDFVYVVNQVARRNPVESIDDLISDNLVKLTSELEKGVMDEDERVFINHFKRGVVLESIRAHAKDKEKEAISMCTASMALGMKRFLSQKKIDTLHELEEYCSYVAGDVGVALNRMVESSDNGLKLDDNGAKLFGRSLQLTNVLKNINEDWRLRGVLYIPEELYLGVSKEELFNKDSEIGKKTRKDVLEKLIAKTRSDLRRSADYITSIPSDLTGYAAFTMIPYISAIETLRAMENGGSEAVFNGEESAVKMNKQTFMNLSKFVYSLMALDNGRRAKEFMDLYKTAQDFGKHEVYCFEPGHFSWPQNLFND